MCLELGGREREGEGGRGREGEGEVWLNQRERKREGEREGEREREGESKRAERGRERGSELRASVHTHGLLGGSSDRVPGRGSSKMTGNGHRQTPSGFHLPCQMGTGPSGRCKKLLMGVSFDAKR